MARLGRESFEVYSGLLLVLLGVATGLFLLANYTRLKQPAGSANEDVERKQVGLISELQALAQRANKSVEDFAKAFLIHQDVTRTLFCTAGKLILDSSLN